MKKQNEYKITKITAAFVVDIDVTIKASKKKKITKIGKKNFKSFFVTCTLL